MKLLKLFPASLLLALPLLGPTARAADLSRIFAGTEGCFALYDLRRDRHTRHNEARCRERFSPTSIFQKPISLIGLETGVIRAAHFVIEWDKDKYPNNGANAMPFAAWYRDHNLRSAFQNSVVWYYQEIALRAGSERMQQFVSAFDYGNEDTSGPVNRFWLDNDKLKISADEQIEFLRKLHANKLPVSRRAHEIVKEIMVQERRPAYTLRAKTGGGPRAEGTAIGWYVGYVEPRDGNTYFFATNIDGPDYGSVRDRRIQITRQALAELGVIPKSLVNLRASATRR